MPVTTSSNRRAKSRPARPGPAAAANVLGCWQLAEPIGIGSHAEVFAARPVDCAAAQPADYALKRLLPIHEQDSLAVDMFRREVACGSQVAHAHLLPILASRTEASPYFYVTPRLAGATIQQVLAAKIEFAVPHALWIVRQVADALESLHLSGWLHGDVKSANIMIDPQGHATLFDYGFARKWQVATSLDQVTLMTTIDYTAPERLTSSRAAGPTSDAYSLGIVLFEMLTGCRPFGNQDAERVAESHLRVPPPSVRSIGPHIPQGVAELVRRMLAKEPTRRPSPHGELQSELLRLETETFGMR